MYVYLFFIVCSNTKDTKYYYIDVFTNGSILSKEDCPRLRGAASCPIKGIFRMHYTLTPVQVSSYSYMVSIKLIKVNII